MKLLMGLLMIMGVAQVANAKPKEVSKKQLNLILKNHWTVAKVKHPGNGLKLFDACVDGDVFRSISNTPASRCAAYSYEIPEDQKFEPSPVKVRVCDRWEKYDPVSSVERLVQKDINCRWTNGFEFPDKATSDSPSDSFVVCDKKTVVQGFPLTQTIEIYSLRENFGDKVYYHSGAHEDKAHAGYRKASYTIPSCGGE